MNVRKLLKKAVGEEGCTNYICHCGSCSDSFIGSLLCFYSLYALPLLVNEDELDKLRRTFNQMAPQNGEIDRDQFQSVMEVVGFRNKENAEQLFNLFDDDGNGKVCMSRQGLSIANLRLRKADKVGAHLLYGERDWKRD